MDDTTVLWDATEVWIAHRGPESYEKQIAACKRLAGYGVFSNLQLAAITGLHKNRVGAITGKSDHRGGRLAVHTLPLMLRLQVDWAGGIRNIRLLRLILAEGTSPRTVARLTGIHLKTIERITA